MSLETSSHSSQLSHNSPSPPMRYFDLLPPELVRIVIEHAAGPFCSEIGAYRRRQNTLRSLRSTTRRFKTLAQHLLLSNVVIGQGSRYPKATLVELVEGTPTEALSSIRTLELVNPGWCESDLNRLERLARATIGLQQLSLSFGSLNRLQPLLALSITTLSLCNIDLRAPVTLHLPQVKYLSIWDCAFDGKDEELRFHLPSLRHLHYTGLDQWFSQVARFHNFVAPTLISTTLQFLQGSPTSTIDVNPRISKCYDARAWHSPPLQEQDRLSTQTLRLDFGIDLPSRLLHHFSEKETESIPQWSGLISRVADLAAIILPPESKFSHHPQSHQDAFAGLVQTCRDRQIKVIREDRSYGKTFWNEVSPSFIRRSEARHEASLSQSN